MPIIAATHLEKVVTATLHLRRREGHTKIPDFSEFVGCPVRKRMSNEEFALHYGAHPDDAQAVQDYCASSGFTVVAQNAAARQVQVSGPVSTFNNAFSITIQDGQRVHPTTRATVHYMDHGHITAPPPLSGVLLHLSGIKDTYDFIHRGPQKAPDVVVAAEGVGVVESLAGQPTTTTGLSPTQVKSTLYGWPTNSASGQNIGLYLISEGYTASDISATCAGFGVSVPTITPVFLPGSGSKTNPGTVSGEYVIDICTLAAFAPGAGIVTYFTDTASQFPSDLAAMIHPPSGSPVCNVLSWSFGFQANQGSPEPGIPQDGMLTVCEQLFQDAAIQGMTIVESSGDWGAAGVATLPNPPADTNVALFGWPVGSPWILTVGGTIIGNVSGSTFTEWIWTDNSGGTGGGVSTVYDLPSYQASAGIPTQLNTGLVGRGVPDVAGNASPNSGYTYTIKGAASQWGGTSQAAPMYAGLIATMNASLGAELGFLNPTLYAIGNTGGHIRKVTSGASNEATSNFYVSSGITNQTTTNINVNPGYPSKSSGWDACTGWGVITSNFLAYIGSNRPTAPSPVPVPGMDVWLYVAALTNAGFGPASNTLGPIAVSGGPVAPITITSMYMHTQSSISSSNPVACWLAGDATTPVTYNIYTSTTPNGTFLLSGTYVSNPVTPVPPNDEFTALLTVTSGVVYYMKIQASNIVSTGPMSDAHGPFQT